MNWVVQVSCRCDQCWENSQHQCAAASPSVQVICFCSRINPTAMHALHSAHNILHTFIDISQYTGPRPCAGVYNKRISPAHFFFISGCCVVCSVYFCPEVACDYGAYGFCNLFAHHSTASNCGAQSNSQITTPERRRWRRRVVWNALNDCACSGVGLM